MAAAFIDMTTDKSVYAFKINKEDDDVVKWKHNYRLTDCQCNVVWLGQFCALLCLRYSLDHKNIQKWCFFLRSMTTKNENFTTCSSKCSLSVRIQSTHGISHFLDDQCAYSSKGYAYAYTQKHFHALFDTRVMLHSATSLPWDFISLQNLFRMKSQHWSRNYPYYD